VIVLARSVLVVAPSGPTVGPEQAAPYGPDKDGDEYSRFVDGEWAADLRRAEREAGGLSERGLYRECAAQYHDRQCAEHFPDGAR